MCRQQKVLGHFELMSLIYSKNNNGPSVDPWDTPQGLSSH